MKLVITGGHHSSAIPVIDVFKKKYPEVEIYWVGHKHTLKNDKNETLEYKEISSIGIPFFNLHAGKVYRTYNISRLIKVPLGFFQALYLLKKIKPDMILSFGGYLAVPVALAGFILKIPCITHEQTTVVGYANRVVSLLAKKILVSWLQSLSFFPKKKTILTGIPLRNEIFKYSDENIKINNRLPVIYITAGKTGSHFINNTVKEALPELLKICNIIHQCGDNSLYNDFDVINGYYANISGNLPGVYISRKFVFSNEIGEVYSKSSLVISRSGAHTISELLVLKKPCILIPIPWASHNEQYHNAKLVEEAGLGIIIEEKDITSEYLVNKISYVLNHISEYKVKDESILLSIKSNAADIIADEVIKTYNEYK